MSRIQQAYGPVGYRQRIQQALTKPNPAEEVMRVEIAAALAQFFTDWPLNRLKELETTDRPASPRRGGY